MNIKEEFRKFQSWLIKHRNNYAQLLSEKPYCIEIKYDTVFNRNLAVFKYSQIDSDFSQPFVKLCRGLILDADTFDIVSFPFVKFHNYGETHADEIDWNSCYVTEKLDGSISKIVRLNGNLLISTNSMIDAYKAPIAEQIGCKARSFGELIDEAVLNAYRENNPDDKVCNPVTVYNWFYYLFDADKTYIFELTSPFNKVVVSWKETRLNFLGLRDNKTFEETFFGDHQLKDVFNTPKVFPLTSVDECVKAAEQLDCNAEGYVVCDRNFNRVKIKSPVYCALHHMKNNGILSYERGLEIVRGNELDEVLTYFPEFGEHLTVIKEKYDNLMVSLETAWEGFQQIVTTAAPRKEAAIWIQKNFQIPGVGFSLLDGKCESVKDWLLKCPAKNLVKWLGFKEV